MDKKYLSLEETNNILPEVALLLRKSIKIRNSIGAMTSIRLEFEDDFSALANSINTGKYLHKFNYEFYGVLSELLNLGCIVKDLNLGLVDFYSKHDGKDIFLCWRLGEEKINFWHEVDAGYSERKPVSLLKKAL